MNMPDEKRRDALERAFEEHYEGDWITALSGPDAICLIQEQWAKYREDTDEPLIWKHQAVVDILTSTAEKHCERFAEAHADDYLDEEEF